MAQLIFGAGSAHGALIYRPNRANQVLPPMAVGTLVYGNGRIGSALVYLSNEPGTVAPPSVFGWTKIEQLHTPWVNL